VPQSLVEVDQLWKFLDLPQTPKDDALIAHALIQAMDIGGFGGMLEDELANMHQEALCVRSRVARLRSMAARANAFSASEKVRKSRGQASNQRCVRHDGTHETKIGTGVDTGYAKASSEDSTRRETSREPSRGEGCHQRRTDRAHRASERGVCE
jgi:hypothetical protein